MRKISLQEVQYVRRDYSDGSGYIVTNRAALEEELARYGIRSP